MTSARCLDCLRYVPQNELGAWYENTGWVEHRKDQGRKGNSVHQLAPTGRVVCAACAALRAAGLPAGQQGMGL